MKNISAPLFIAFLLCSNSLAQKKKSVEAHRISAPITIDGILDEDVYKQEDPAKDFVQIQPYNGKATIQPTEVYIFYDQSAIYVGAQLYDNHPDRSFNYLTDRDN